jgi:hypothetical protein
MRWTRNKIVINELKKKEIDRLGFVVEIGEGGNVEGVDGFWV